MLPLKSKRTEFHIAKHVQVPVRWHKKDMEALCPFSNILPYAYLPPGCSYVFFVIPFIVSKHKHYPESYQMCHQTKWSREGGHGNLNSELVSQNFKEPRVGTWRRKGWSSWTEPSTFKITCYFQAHSVVTELTWIRRHPAAQCVGK